MKFNFVPMNKEYAHEIAFDWTYDGVYAFYDMTADEEDLKEFINPDQWNNKFAVLDYRDNLIGFYSFYFNEDIMWIGFGLKPELTGKGIGKSFVLSGIEFGITHYKYKEDYVILAVAKFNKRAIKTYEHIGFIVIEEFIQQTNGGEYEFIKMKYEISTNKNN